MNPYEEMIKDKVNQTAGRNVWFKVQEIMDLSETTFDAVICELLGYACSATNVMPITIGRQCLQSFPADLMTEKIKKLAFSAIDMNDDWDYRRLLEVAKLISEDLLIWTISIGENSENRDIDEASNDFGLHLILDRLKNNTSSDKSEISKLIRMLEKDAEYNDWESTTEFLDTQIIDEYLFDYLYKNRICLEKLAHMKLSDRHLKKLSADYDEALITLAVRYFTSDDYSVAELINLLKDCKYDSVFEMLYFVSDSLTEKSTAVNYAVSKNKYLTSDEKEHLHKLYRSKMLLFSDDEEVLTNAFEENEPVYMLSLSKNINTPEDILNKLINISGIKYASQIRSNSRKILKYKE